jgi:D-glycero-D-manno-heptose 1,7-bisphosphate phosphatase
MKKAVFLDRDGVINRSAPDGGYVTRWEDFHILPGVPEAIALLNTANFLVVVATNQRCVAKDLLSLSGLEQLHANLRTTLEPAGARLDAIYFCPHDIFPPCTCRKPLPGMLLDAAKEHHIELSSSWMIGDSASDIEAGKRAGCKTILINQLTELVDPTPDLYADSLLSAAHKILAIASL